jgi:kumamolisin
MARVDLAGSERSALPGAQVVGPADSSERIQVSVIVRRGAADELRSRAAALSTGGQSRGYLTREQFANRHGATPADLGAVRAFAAAQGLRVVLEHAARRTVVLEGTVGEFGSAFGVRLMRMRYPGGSYRGRTGLISVPDELHGIVEAVLGLDNRPQAQPHFRLASGQVRPHPRGKASSTAYTPLQVASLYGFPSGDAQGECIGLIELGGGYASADLAEYFHRLGISSPTVVAVSVDQAGNSPTGSPDGPDGEVMLDIEVAGAIAPQARIVVYFAPNTDAGFLDAITTAIHDSTNKPSVISISWGGPESTWTAQAKTTMDDAFQAAATLGITVCAASGDNGSSDGVRSGADNVDFPASSGFVLACGGTRLTADQSGIAGESAWNDGPGGGATGGGVSAFFKAPAWQAGLSATNAQGHAVALAMRGVPDVAGDADPQTGYTVRIDGTDTVIGGTSAVAPLWAGLIARLNAINGKPAGFINPAIYANPGALRDITVGNNGDYEATLGWDACTGLGTPNGGALRGIIS